MTESNSLARIRRAGLVAGITLLLIAVTAPIAEFGLMPMLLTGETAGETALAVTANRGALAAAILLYTLAFIGDVILAWALFVFLAPADRDFSLLTAWLRVVYAALALVAVLNLVTVWSLTGDPGGYAASFGTDNLSAQVVLALDGFRSWWNFSFALFGLHLVLLGALAIKARYVPSAMGTLLILAGAGYLINGFLKPFFFPDADTDFLMLTFVGELIFMVWLLGWSWRVDSVFAAVAGADT